MTGFMRNGYCEVPASDFGNHSVAAEVTEEFLTFSAKQGNDLRSIGLKGGCKWCLCATRWKEAYEARGREGDKIVPKSVQSISDWGVRSLLTTDCRVFLNATNEKAFNKITLDELKQFAADKEA